VKNWFEVVEKVWMSIKEMVGNKTGEGEDLCILLYLPHNDNEVICLWLTAVPLTS